MRGELEIRNFTKGNEGNEDGPEFHHRGARSTEKEKDMVLLENAARHAPTALSILLCALRVSAVDLIVRCLVAALPRWASVAPCLCG